MEQHICADCGKDSDRIADMLKEQPDTQVLEKIAELLKMFGDPTRVRILFELLETELCVNDIADHLAMTVSAISHQLRILRQARLVKCRRDGKTMFYSLADDHVRTIFCLALEHVLE